MGWKATTPSSLSHPLRTLTGTSIPTIKQHQGPLSPLPFTSPLKRQYAMWLRTQTLKQH